MEFRSRPYLIWPGCILTLLLHLALFMALFDPEFAWADDAQPASQGNLPSLLNPNDPAYRTPRAGEGFATELFGKTITVQPRNMRSTSSVDVGLQVNLPSPDGKTVLPFGAVYLWRHPDDHMLFRADLVGFYNDIFLSGSTAGMKNFEWVLTFENYTLPTKQYELVDGNPDKSQELYWGYVRPGFGFGYRRSVSPDYQDNMFAVDLAVEPGYVYFGRGSDTFPNFVVPNSTFEIREHLQMRWDALERNLSSLPHRGFAAGIDLINSNRTTWHDWGLNAENTGGRHYMSASGYLLGAGGVPGITSERHRLFGSIHAGIGSDLDRFSAPRIGGGAITLGEEYGSSWRPVLPGTVMQEYFPSHYVVGVAAYRWEALFFTHLSLDASIGWLDRQRQTGPVISDTTVKNNFFYAVGTQLTSGFFFKSQMQLTYNYNFAEVRHGRYGGSEIVLHFSHEL
ncbi:MAG TPA: hypothetical protein VMJ66_04575 [Geobacteraceae bacterium]|nr:hypothetical protein [Geobacteraceae bacterium]